MEFIVDEQNNARNIAFLNKTKNQAKKLFKLAKQNALKIEINNLSHAQEILAHINGFPDWHALEATIFNTSKKSLDTPFSIHQITTESSTDNPSHSLYFQTYNDIAYITLKDDLTHKETVKSFISVDYLPVDYHNFTEFLNIIIKDTAFQYNMGFHKFNIIISQDQLVQTINKDVKYFNYNTSLGLSQKQFEELFTVNVTPNFIPESSFRMNILISIETSLDMFDQHIHFCSLFNQFKFSKYLSLLTQLSDNDYQKFNHIEDDSNIENHYKPFYGMNSQHKRIYKHHLKDFISTNFTENNLSHHIYNHKKWIMALDFLSRTKHNWRIDLSLKSSQEESTFSICHSSHTDTDKARLNDKYLSGLYNSLTNSTIYPDHQTMFQYLPLSKGYLPWKSGIPLINYTDKSIEYFQPFSSSQTSSNSIILAKPGSGKSILMNIMNLAQVLSPGADTLPKLGIIDIGPSSLSFVELVQATLSPNDQHLVQYHKLSMSEHYNTNMFDTQLGSRFPLDIERNLLINFLSLLVTPIGEINLPQGMVGLITHVIDHMYLQYSERQMPKLYVKGIHAKVDQCIEQLKISIDHRTTWWEVVDQLFLAGKIKEATLAQCYAVPTLYDCIRATNDTKILEIYSTLTTHNGETLIDQFNFSIYQSIQQFPILSKPTAFNVSDARIVVLDLNDVTISGTEASNYQNSIMYMLARYILGKDYVLNDSSNIEQIPYPSYININFPIPIQQYHAYYKKQFFNNKEDFKILCLDEFHRAGRSAAIQSQILSDFIHARKYGYAIHVVSQSITDFNNDLCSLASSIFIMDSGNEKNIENITNTFSLDQHEKQLLQYVHGPIRGKPGVFFAKFNTTTGNYSKIVSIPANNFLLTALTTTSEDMLIRQKLTDIIGYFKAIKYLSKYYPFGVKKTIEQKRESLQNNHMDFNIDNICNELINSMIFYENLHK